MKWKRRMRKVAAYVLLVVIAFLTGSLMKVNEYNEYTQEIASEKAFYATDMFADQLDFLIKNVVYYLHNTGEIETTVKMQDEDEIYRLLEYKGEKISKTTLSGQSERITYKKLKLAGSSSEAVLTGAERGDDRGNDFYFFYGNWNAQAFTNLQYQFEKEGTENIHYFLKVTGRQYYDLLKKYTRKQLDKEEGQSVYYYKNKATGNNIKYRKDGELSCFKLEAFGDTYDYDIEDVNRNKNFYFILDELDCSSLESLETSIITTPFTTVKATLIPLALHKQIQTQKKQMGKYYANRLQDIDYTVELDNGKKLGNLEQRRRKKKNYELLLSVDQSYGLDAKSKKRIEKGTLNVTNSIQNNMADWHIKKITIGVRKGMQFTKLKFWKYMCFVKKYTAFYEIIILLAIIAELIFCGFIVRDKLQMSYSWYDKIAFEWRSLGSGIGAFISLGIAAGIANSLYYYRNFVFLLLPVILAAGAVFYVILLEYILSIIQNVHYKKIKENLILFRIKKKIVRTCKNLAKNRNVTVRCAMLCGGYIIYNLFLGMIFLIGAGSVAGGICIVLLLAGNGYVIYRIYQDMRAHDVIQQGVQRIIDGDLSYQISEETLQGRKRELAQAINRIGEGLDKAVAVSIRDERLKAELITNVSHDIKTPLTSIINYVDLLKRENLTQEPVCGYIEVLNQKALRLKQLIEDLVEVSKASTGNLELECMNLNMTELLQQTMGEFEDRFTERELQVFTDVQQKNMVVYADGRRMFRILENLFSNVCKYSMHHTRVYVSLHKKEEKVCFCIKNISKDALDIDPEELTQRFVRGEQSRTTEGSGLGLSIVKNLVELQKGEFTIAIDGDLFKVMITFPAVEMTKQ